LGEVAAHLEADAAARRAHPDFHARSEQLTESDRQILSELPPERFASEVLRRAASAQRIERARNRGPSRAAWGSAAIAACLALAFVVVRDPGVAPPPPDSPPVAVPSGKPGVAPVPPPQVATTLPAVTQSVKPDQIAADWRTKGDIELVLQRESPDGLQPVTVSDKLSAGTRLRLSVTADLPWAAIYSIDSKGEMAQHWPLQGSNAEPLAQGMLPRAWELDATPGRETFVLIRSQKPFALEIVRKAIFLNRVAPRLPKELRVSVVGLAKSAEPAK
ncbi:MAG: hypothetical protein AAB214_12940, partial [Fibrobacterota bacterium]